MTRKVPGYDAAAELGRGATGTVVSARDSATGGEVAIKFLSDGVYKYPNFLSRFRREAAIIDGIEHPNVVQTYEFVEQADGGAIVSQLVDGVSLRRLLDEAGALEPEAAFYVLHGVLLGLGEAHGRGVVHRDLRPDNVLIDTDGVVKVGDIGIAARPRRSSPFAGDPRYAAPELWAGAEPTPATDVYAAAATLSELLSGTPPRVHDVTRHAGSLDEFITSLRGAEPPNQVRVLLASGLAAEATGRPADADAMLDDLERVAALAYGAKWEETGRSYLARRLAPVLTQAPGDGQRSGRRRATGSAGIGAAIAGVGALATGVVAGFMAKLPAKRSARPRREEQLPADEAWTDALADSTGDGSWATQSGGLDRGDAGPGLWDGSEPASGPPALSRGRSRAAAEAAAAAAAQADPWIEAPAASWTDTGSTAAISPASAPGDRWDGTSTESWGEPPPLSRGRSRAAAEAAAAAEAVALEAAAAQAAATQAAAAGAAIRADSWADSPTETWTPARPEPRSGAPVGPRSAPPAAPRSGPRPGPRPGAGGASWSESYTDHWAELRSGATDTRSAFWSDSDSDHDGEEDDRKRSVRSRRAGAGAGQLRGIATGAGSGMRRAVGGAGSGVKRAAGFVGGLGNAWLLGAGSVLILGSAVILAVVTGAFATDKSPTGSSTTRDTVVVPGPAVPSATGGADSVKPDQPTGLKVLGQSETAVSLDWEASRDNDRVLGYIVTLNGQQAGTTALPGYTASGLTPNTKYDFTVTAFDPAGNQSPASPIISATTLAAPDTTAPTVPAGLRSTGRSATTVALAWNVSTDDVGVAGYDVFRDGARVATVVRAVYTDTGLAAASSHTYAVRAFDTANNASAKSPTITVATLAAADTTPPSAPGAVTATATGTTTVNITWTAATDNIGVAQYRVSRNGTQVGTVTATSFPDTGLTAGVTYNYTVVAADAAGNVSAAGTATATTFTVTGLSVNASPVSGAPECETTITANVTTTGSMTVVLTYTVTGVSGTQTKSVDVVGGGGHPVSLGTGNGHANGTVAVDHTPSGQSDDTTWTAPDECLPSPAP